MKIESPTGDFFKVRTGIWRIPQRVATSKIRIGEGAFIMVVSLGPQGRIVGCKPFVRAAGGISSGPNRYPTPLQRHQASGEIKPVRHVCSLIFPLPPPFYRPRRYSALCKVKLRPKNVPPALVTSGWNV